MRRIQDFFNKILYILLIVVLNSNVLLFAEDSLKLDGSYLVGCSFLEKTFFGMSNFREREYEFTDNHLFVTNFKKKTYTQYSYIIKGDFIHLKKEKGTDDYFDDTVMKFEISSKSLLSKRELILWPSAGKPLKFVEEESLRKRASNVALGTAAVAGTVAVAGAAVSSGVGAGEAAKKIITDGSHLVNGKLKPNVTYKTGEFGYKYKTDSKGRISNWSTDNLQLTKRANRLPYNSNTLGKIDGDHAGHLAADRFGGSPDIDNLVSQSSRVNLSEYKKIENIWADAISKGKKVTTNVEVLYDKNSSRPKGFNVQYTIDGMAYMTRILN